MKRVALYARVSTDRQASEGDSIQAQLDALRKYAENHNYIIAGEYVDDGISGSLFNERDELQRLLDDVRAGKIDVIAFTKLDRYYRSVKHYLNTQSILDECGVGWIAIWEHYDTTTPQGRLMISQMLSFAQFETENTALRINRVFDYKKTQREAISGQVPFGYSIVDKHIVPNSDAEYVRKAFDLYLQNGTMSATIRMLKGTGVPETTRGFKHLLQNRKYIGESYGYDDYCEPIIDKDTFDEVQRLLDMNIRSGRTHDYIFSGILVCAECGGKMCGCYNYYSRNKEVKYYKYRCEGYHRPIKRCDNKTIINEKKLEKHLVQNLEQYAFDDVEVSDRKEVIDYQKLIDATEKKISRLKDLYVNELINLDEYKRDLEQYQREIIEYRKKLSGSKTTGKDELKRLIGMNLVDWYWTLTDIEKRTLWRSVIQEIRVGKDKSVDVVFR